MARPKRPPSPMLKIAREYLARHAPELKDAKLYLRHLDGPPDSPRYAVSAYVCGAMHDCPYGIDPAIAEAGKCPILSCMYRESIRLLINREGEVVQARHSDVNWR